MAEEHSIKVNVDYDKENITPNDSIQVFLNGHVCGHFQYDENLKFEYFIDTENLLPSGLSETFERAANTLSEDDLCKFMEKEINWEVEKNLPFYEALGFCKREKEQ